MRDESRQRRSLTFLIPHPSSLIPHPSMGKKAALPERHQEFELAQRVRSGKEGEGRVAGASRFGETAHRGAHEVLPHPLVRRRTEAGLKLATPTSGGYPGPPLIRGGPAVQDELPPDGRLVLDPTQLKSDRNASRIPDPVQMHHQIAVVTLPAGGAQVPRAPREQPGDKRPGVRTEIGAHL